MLMVKPLRSISEVQTELIEIFEALPDWQERYQYIIELGQSLPTFPDIFKIDKNKISGCQSQVWIVHDIQYGHLFFQAGSDAIITAGLISLVLTVYNGRSPKDILMTPPSFIKNIGLSQHLSQNRNNGLLSMVRRIFEIANNEANNGLN
jgi:cysteine desulfuration protein SufE